MRGISSVSLLRATDRRVDGCIECQKASAVCDAFFPPKVSRRMRSAEAQRQLAREMLAAVRARLELVDPAEMTSSSTVRESLAFVRALHQRSAANEATTKAPATRKASTQACIVPRALKEDRLPMGAPSAG